MSCGALAGHSGFTCSANSGAAECAGQGAAWGVCVLPRAGADQGTWAQGPCRAGQRAGKEGWGRVYSLPSTGPPSGPTVSTSWRNGLCHTGRPSPFGTQAGRAVASTVASRRGHSARWALPPQPHPARPCAAAPALRPASCLPPGGRLLRRGREQDQEGLLLLRGVPRTWALGAPGGEGLTTYPEPGWTLLGFLSGHPGKGPDSCQAWQTQPRLLGSLGPQSHLHAPQSSPQVSLSPTSGWFCSGCRVAGRGPAMLGPALCVQLHGAGHCVGETRSPTLSLPRPSGKAQAPSAHPALPSGPATLCHLREAGECWAVATGHEDRVAGASPGPRGDRLLLWGPGGWRQPWALLRQAAFL